MSTQKTLNLTFDIGDIAYHPDPDVNFVYPITITKVSIIKDGIFYEGEYVFNDPDLREPMSFAFGENKIGVLYFSTKEEAKKMLDAINAIAEDSVLYLPDQIHGCVHSFVVDAVFLDFTNHVYLHGVTADSFPSEERELYRSEIGHNCFLTSDAAIERLGELRGKKNE